MHQTVTPVLFNSPFHTGRSPLKSNLLNFSVNEIPRCGNHMLCLRILPTEDVIT